MKKYIYKITNLINGKIYIGQTKDIHRRFREHRNCGYCQHKDKVLYNAIEKYGVENFSFEIIEYTEKYNERERYWTKYYHSDSREYGYNIVPAGIPKPHRGFVSEDEYEAICNDLLDYSLSFQDIADKYNFITAQSIRELNKGIIYYHPDKEYPIRPDRNTLAQIKAKEVIEKLKNSDYSFKEISDMLDLDVSYIYSINVGLRCKIEGEEYPIRPTLGKDRKKRKKLTTQEVEDLKKDIINTSLTWREIGQKYNVGLKVCQHINQGITHFDPKLTYPLRQTKKYAPLTQEQVDSIYNELLNTDKRQKDIAVLNDVSESAVNGINLGRYHRREGYKYPLRQ